MAADTQEEKPEERFRENISSVRAVRSSESLSAPPAYEANTGMNQQPIISPVVSASDTNINIDAAEDTTTGSGSAAALDSVDGAPNIAESARDGGQSMRYCQRRRVRLDRDRMSRGGFMVTR